MAVPLEVFRWVVCIPYGGKFVEENGERRPVPHLNKASDWSYDIDLFFEGKPIGPFYKCDISLFRDDPSMLPKVKVELNG